MLAAWPHTYTNKYDTPYISLISGCYRRVSHSIGDHLRDDVTAHVLVTSTLKAHTHHPHQAKVMRPDLAGPTPCIAPLPPASPPPRPCNALTALGLHWRSYTQGCTPSRSSCVRSASMLRCAFVRSSAVGASSLAGGCIPAHAATCGGGAIKAEIICHKMGATSR